MKKKNVMRLLSLVIALVAMLFGGADLSMAATAADLGTAGDTSPSDGAAVPTEGTAIDGARKDEQGLATQLPNTAASTTQVGDGGLIEDEIDPYVAKFRPWAFPLDTDIRLKAKTRDVKNYEQKHYQSGQDSLSAVTNAILTNTEKNEIVKLPVSSEDYAIFAPFSTISVPDVSGYAEDGKTTDGSLVLFVLDKNNTGVYVKAVNGMANGTKRYVPDIPAGAQLDVMDIAASESQMITEPENYQPRPVVVYLQKKLTNIVFTDDFKESIKKLPFYEQDVLDDSLYKFRRKCCRGFWLNQQSKFKVTTKDMGVENVYTSRGLLRQLTMNYALGDTLTYEDLINIASMQFGKYSVSKEAEVYCGLGYMQKLLLIDYTKHKDIQFVPREDIGIDIRSFKCTLGTLNFKYEPTLNDIGYQDCAVVVDMTNAVRYRKVEKKQFVVNMKEGAGENREAERRITIQSDCLALKGFNSILIAPSDQIMGKIKNPNSDTVTSAAAVPTTDLKDGMVVLLTADSGEWAKGSLIQYDATSKGWKEYVGSISA